jgi:hypothetical protein
MTAVTPGNCASIRVRVVINSTETSAAKMTITGLKLQMGGVATPWAPLSEPSYPDVLSNDLYRREAGSIAWSLIKKGITSDQSYKDYTIISGKSYEYMVKVTGTNGATNESATMLANSVNFTGAIIHDVYDIGSGVIALAYDGSGKSYSWQPELSLMQFQGRTKPVAEYGSAETEGISVTVDMQRNKAELDLLISMIRRNTILCYRDGRGRLMFVVAGSGIPTTDEFYGYTVNLDFKVVAYVEGV